MDHEKNRNISASVQTPSGPRVVPEWAQCYCVTQHRPAYAYPYPFQFPTGVEIWLCPNTYHQVITLKKLYLQLSGPPASDAMKPFSLFVRAVLEYYWLCELKKQAKDGDFFSRQPGPDPTGESDELFTDYVREVTQHG